MPGYGSAGGGGNLQAEENAKNQRHGSTGQSCALAFSHSRREGVTPPVQKRMPFRSALPDRPQWLKLPPSHRTHDKHGGVESAGSSNEDQPCNSSCSDEHQQAVFTVARVT